MCIFDKNSVKSNVAMTFFPRDSAMVHLKSIAKSLGILQWFFAISKKSLGKKVIATFMRFHGILNLHYKILPYSLFSKPCWNIVLRDRRAGGYGFCNPRESYFIPRGEAPRDEIRLPRVCKNIASQSAITQWYCYREFTK